jgi:hypothetical protein
MTAAAQMIADHRRWYELAIAEIEQRLADVERREAKLAENESWVSSKRDAITKAIADARS